MRALCMIGPLFFEEMIMINLSVVIDKLPELKDHETSIFETSGCGVILKIFCIATLRNLTETVEIF